jgi:hypothetical protein
MYESKFISKHSIPGCKHESICYHETAIAREDQKDDIPPPQRPVQRISWTVARLWNENDVLVPSGAVFQKGNYQSVQKSWESTIRAFNVFI